MNSFSTRFSVSMTAGQVVKNRIWDVTDTLDEFAEVVQGLCSAESKMNENGKGRVFWEDPGGEFFHVVF